jgi:hypothetical protein
MSTLSIRKFRGILFGIILAVAPLLAASQAETLGPTVSVNVPFAFENGSQHFAAGLYTICMESHNVLMIQGKSGSGFALTWFDEDMHPSQATKVVFVRYGSQYFLDQVWVTGETSHTYLLRSRAEILHIAANEAAPTSVTIAALGTPR